MQERRSCFPAMLQTRQRLRRGLEPFYVVARACSVRSYNAWGWLKWKTCPGWYPLGYWNGWRMWAKGKLFMWSFKI